MSEAAGVPGAEILRILMNEGVMGTLNSQMDPEMTQLVAGQLGITLEFTTATSLEDELLAEIGEHVDAEEDLVDRPPVITFLGHVDHGKTSLLDKIIGIDVVSGESGGITQHIRAYQIEKDGRTDLLRRHARPRSVYRNAGPRRQRDRHRRAGRGGRRRRHAADRRSHQPRPRGRTCRSSWR